MEIRTRRTLVGAAWACVGLLGLSALTGVAVAAEQSRAAPAAVGAAAAVPSAGAGSGAAPARPGLRALGSRIVHGELTVHAKGGLRTIDIQLGTVTAASSTSLTVRSQDGYTLTWTLAPDTVVRAAGAGSSAAALAVGQTVRVLGPAATSPGGSPTARLVRVRQAGTAGGPARAGASTAGSASPSATSSSA